MEDLDEFIITSDKSVVECSKCGKKYNYYGVLPEDKESMYFCCHLCQFPFIPLPLNSKSKNSLLVSTSKKSNQLNVKKTPLLWLNTSYVDKDHLDRLSKLFEINSKINRGKISRGKEKFRCVNCGKELKRNSYYIKPFVLACVNCGVTLERLGLKRDDWLGQLFVYRENYNSTPWRFLNGFGFTKFLKRIDRDKTTSNLNVKDYEIHGKNPWSEEDKARIKEEEGLSDEDMDDGAYIDF